MIDRLCNMLSSKWSANVTLTIAFQHRRTNSNANNVQTVLNVNAAGTGQHRNVIIYRYMDEKSFTKYLH